MSKGTFGKASSEAEKITQLIAERRKQANQSGLTYFLVRLWQSEELRKLPQRIEKDRLLIPLHIRAATECWEEKVGYQFETKYIDLAIGEMKLRFGYTTTLKFKNGKEFGELELICNGDAVLVLEVAKEATVGTGPEDNLWHFGILGYRPGDWESAIFSLDSALRLYSGHRARREIESRPMTDADRISDLKRRFGLD